VRTAASVAMTGGLEGLSVRLAPRASRYNPVVDVLGDLLAITRLTGDVLSHSLCDPPWGLRYQPAPHVWFHIVATGACQLMADRGAAHQLGPNDLVLLPHGTGHVLCDRPDSRCITVDLDWLASAPRPIMVSTGRRLRGGLRSEILCGNYTVAAATTHPALRSLPKVIRVPGREVVARAGMHATTQELWRELDRGDIGSPAVVSRLLEVLFVQVLRYWLDTQPPGSTSWLGALRDAPIGKALGLLHTTPERAWTVRTLAREVGLSRPVFARRFAGQVGEAPMSYLRRVRVERASQLLVETRDSLGAIAAAVGYTSEYAFNRAFTRERRVPPGRYRSEHAQRRTGTTTGR
jgi:AraC-like DNA-binding protein